MYEPDGGVTWGTRREAHSRERFVRLVDESGLVAAAAKVAGICGRRLLRPGRSWSGAPRWIVGRWRAGLVGLAPAAACTSSSRAEAAGEAPLPTARSLRPDGPERCGPGRPSRRPCMAVADEFPPADLRRVRLLLRPAEPGPLAGSGHARPRPADRACWRSRSSCWP